MTIHHCVNALGRFLQAGSERKRLRQLSLARCLAPHYGSALQARNARQADHRNLAPHATHPTR